MKLTKVYRILKFKQCDCLKKHIDFNTGKRKNTANSFEKDFFKLMNNSSFGKALMNNSSFGKTMEHFKEKKS